MQDIASFPPRLHHVGPFMVSDSEWLLSGALFFVQDTLSIREYSVSTMTGAIYVHILRATQTIISLFS